MKTLKYILSVLVLAVFFILPVSAAPVSILDYSSAAYSFDEDQKSNSQTQLTDTLHLDVVEMLMAQAATSPTIFTKVSADHNAILSRSFQLSIVETSQFKVYILYNFHKSFVKDIIFPFHSFL